ncbi:hypothetical protein DCE79_02610 [Lysinibacillus sp. 2017]|uniref:hypothetical protein n=1 Tax=unclassified Lysinibacillus TaxID=2636778 RepID=UPI000D52A05A|nr:MULTISPECIES: hypothetical protein [unclassified Lysinibacillus]AWE06343.1 hypothetical protein DCE79_02610 [Lysinibacillus sp. 2017]TGN35037.1 hypothetical protein E4L99_11790 [Lysinibacillus sp. S2017]
MSILNERYVRVTINNETYFREIGVDDVLGERMAEDEFNNLILDAVYSDIIEEEYMVNLQQVNTIIQTIPNVFDRQILQNFYNYAVRIDGEE